jgi:hypothetical protein
MAGRFYRYIAFSLLLFSAAAGAQETDQRIGERPSQPPGYAWRIYHSDGGDFALTSKGKLQNYGPKSAEDGIVLQDFDTIQTGSGRVELQLLPRGRRASGSEHTLLKAGENTSLLVHSERNGTFTLELLYGRIRIVTGTVPDRGITVVSGNTALEVKEGDFGVDFEIRSASTRPVFRVHCFKGEGRLLPLIQEGSSDIPRLPVASKETLTLELYTPFSYVERGPLDQDLLRYWDIRNFSGSTPQITPDTSLPAVQNIPEEPDLAQAAAPPALPPVVPGLPADQKRRKNTGIGVGLLLVAAGSVMHGLNYFGNGSLDAEMRKTLLYSGYVPLGMGSIVLFSTLFYNP